MAFVPLSAALKPAAARKQTRELAGHPALDALSKVERRLCALSCSSVGSAWDTTVTRWTWRALYQHRARDSAAIVRHILPWTYCHGT